MSVDETMNDIQYPREGGADLVEVCRCKDCKWSRKHNLFENQSYELEYWQCERSELGEYQIIEQDDFCSRGERRDGN